MTESKQTDSTGDPLENGTVANENLLTEVEIEYSEQHRNRTKILHTIFLACLGCILGWVLMQNGVVFLDINLITDVDIETGSWYPSGHATGYFIGSLIGGALYDVYNKYLLIFLTIVGATTTVISLPWCSNFWFMVFAYITLGAFGGAIDTEITAEISRIWNKKAGPYYEVYYFTFAVGGCISPLVTDPFLAKKVLTPLTYLCGNFINDNTSEHSYTFANETHVWPNYIHLNNSQEAWIGNLSGNCSINGSDISISRYEESSIQYAYLVSGILYFLCGIPFLIFFIKHSPTSTSTECENSSLPIGKSLKVLLLSVIGCLILFYQGIEDTFAYFIMMYVVDEHDWTKSDAAKLVSTFKVVDACTLFAGIFLLMKVKPSRILCVLCILLITGLTGLTIASHLYNDTMIWIFTGLCGASMSMYCPAVFILTETRCFSISGKIAGYFIAMVCVGAAVNPLIIGFLMEEYTGMWFLYVLLIEAIMCSILFIIWVVILRYKVKKVN